MNYVRLLWQLYRKKQTMKKSKEQVRALQEKKLRKLLLYAYEHSAYYREAFEAAGITADRINSTSLEQFPTLNKELLMEHYDEIVTDPNVRQSELRRFGERSSDSMERYFGKYHVVHSSGSTGIPRYFLYDERAWEEVIISVIRGALWDLSFRKVLKLLAGKPRILYIAATDGRYGGAMAVHDGIQGVRAEQRFLDIDIPLSKWLETVQEFQPNIIIGYPSAIKIFAELIETEQAAGKIERTEQAAGKIERTEQAADKIEHTEQAAGKIERVVTCGEPLTPGMRSYFESVFHAPVINYYGASESLALGVEHNAADGMILFDDMNIIELIDGEMYITCLYNFAQPLIRYHISDKLIPRVSNSGFTSVDVVLCREEDVLWFETKNGREYLHPLSVEGFCVDGLLDYQFCKDSDSSFEMIAELSDITLGDQVKQAVTQQMESILEKNGLRDIAFTVRFVNQILPDPNTGKKALILQGGV